MSWRIFGVALVALLVVSGCGTARARPVTPVSGLVLAVRTEGGLAPSPMPVRVPDVVLYGDGRIIESDRYRPVSARVAWTTRAYLERIVQRAYDLGLDRARRMPGHEQVMDGTTTSLVFGHDGRRSATVVGPMADDRLMAFAADLSLDRIPRRDLRAAPRTYRPAQVAVLAQPAPGRPDDMRRWPLRAPERMPALGDTSCATYDADQATKILGTRPYWLIGDHPVRLTAVPPLPGEHGCADLPRRP